MDSLLIQAEQKIEQLSSTNRALVDLNTKLSRQVKTLERQVNTLAKLLADADYETTQVEAQHPAQPAQLELPSLDQE